MGLSAPSLQTAEGTLGHLSPSGSRRVLGRASPDAEPLCKGAAAPSVARSCLNKAGWFNFVFIVCGGREAGSVRGSKLTLFGLLLL